jgi:hypothetical protein
LETQKEKSAASPLNFIDMGIFSFLKNAPDQQPYVPGPYKDSAINLIYQLIFCDDINLYKSNAKPPVIYPYDILFKDGSSVADLQKIAVDTANDPRHRVLACNRLISLGHTPVNKELLGVIVEVALDEGLDVLASFCNGTARYINHTERLLVWETQDDEKANQLKDDLFNSSRAIVAAIGPWDKPRRPSPAKGNLRISFLVSDGLYFGEGPMNVLFNDTMAAPALTAATQLMQYLTATDLAHTKK